MSTPNLKRFRGRRVSGLELPPGKWRSIATHLRRGAVVVRLSLTAGTLLGLGLIFRVWTPPTSFHPGQTPQRDVCARIAFQLPDDEQTAEARQRQRRLAVAVYEHDPAPLVQLRARIQNEITELASTKSFDALAPELWAAYSPPRAESSPEPTAEDLEKQFSEVRAALNEEGKLELVRLTIDEALSPLERYGLLTRLPPEHDANQEEISIRLVDSREFAVNAQVGQVLLESATRQLQRAFDQKLPSLDLAERLFARLRTDLPETLRLDSAATRAEQDRAAERVEQQFKDYPPGTVLAPAGTTLAVDSIRLLEAEHRAWTGNLTTWQAVRRATAVLAVYSALLALVAFALLRTDPTVLERLPKLVTLLAAVLLTALAVGLANWREWRAESIPLLLLAMTGAIAYGRMAGLVICLAMTAIAALGMGQGLHETALLLAPACAAVVALDSVRTRSKLLLVGFIAAAAAAAMAVCVGQIEGWSMAEITQSALRSALWAVIAASLMTCLLPLVERVFDVQTDLSLLELGDPAHPLLQELVRRAPGTYNHSITVASLAEAAAESIGGRGLLVRVGAYFHDIGKMLKPHYFVENQSPGDNRHQGLAPAMSTLVIIAHVKDGVDLARQHHLPESIVDFIQQHHGTTLVEYFYRQASSRRESPDDSVDESAFRYPGPKPQTKETAVLMVSDAVESASRVLVEPTPARIESLVEDIARKRLLDGQFDECGLTLQEVHLVCESLVKSLTAVYHGRVKYPEQESA